MKSWKFARNAVFGTVIAVALAFGGRQVLAGASQGGCPFDPPTQLGACMGESEAEQLEDCRNRCDQQPGSWEALCPGGCCTCIAT